MFGCFLKGFALIEIRLFIGFCCPILHTSYWRDFIEQHYKAGDRVGVFLCVCHTTHHVRTFIEQLLRLSCKLFFFFIPGIETKNLSLVCFLLVLRLSECVVGFFSLPQVFFFFFLVLLQWKLKVIDILVGSIFICLIKRINYYEYDY